MYTDTLMDSGPRADSKKDTSCHLLLRLSLQKPWVAQCHGWITFPRYTGIQLHLLHLWTLNSTGLANTIKMDVWIPNGNTGNTQTLFPTKRCDKLLLSIIYSNDIQDHKNNLKLEISSSQVQVLKRIVKILPAIDLHWGIVWLLQGKTGKRPPSPNGPRPQKSGKKRGKNHGRFYGYSPEN